MQVWILKIDWANFCNGKKIVAIKDQLAEGLNLDDYKKINLAFNEIIDSHIGYAFCTIEKKY